MDFSIIKSSCIGATRNAWAKPERPCDYRKKDTSEEDYVAKIFSLFAPYLQGLSDAKIINLQAKLHTLLSKYKASKGAD